jgi:hypothetical protein
MLKSERIEHGVYVFHAHAVDEHVSRGIVPDRNHHGRARSRKVTRVTPGVSPPMMSLSGTYISAGIS